jgi:hypothetical protein
MRAQHGSWCQDLPAACRAFFPKVDDSLPQPAEPEGPCARPDLARPGLALQVLERIKEPLQTLVSRDHFETAYAVLAHFLLIAQRAPILFSQVAHWQPPTCDHVPLRRK